MALSRFFTIIIISSIGWAFFLLLTGKLYSLTSIVNRNVVRVLSSLVIEGKDLRRGLNIIEESLAELTS